MRLKGLRTSRNMLQKDVAGLLGIDRTTYAKYESGASEPNHETLLKLAQIFNVTTDYLLGRDENEPAPIQLNEDEFDKNRIMAAFLGGDHDLSPEDQDALWEDVYEYARFKAEQWKRKKDK